MNSCVLCLSNEIDEVRFGKLIEDSDSVSVHEKCLYLTTGLFQRGSSMFYDFQKKDILAARQRHTSFTCVYCHLKGANIICNEKFCGIKFHTGCGISHNVQNQFVGEYASYCHSHVQSTKHQPDPTDKCPLCFEDLMEDDGVFTPSKMIQSPCCFNGWYHWKCLQSYALSSGYFFKCPLCCNTTKIRDVAYWGIYIPMRDAAWELEPGAFSELNIRDSTCVAAQCHNPNGRNDPTNLLQCIRCGSSPKHLSCLPRDFPVKINICTACSTTNSMNEDPELDALDYYLLLASQPEQPTSNYHHAPPSSDSEDEILAAFEAQQAIRRNLRITNLNSTGTGATTTREEEPLIDVNCRQNTLSSRCPTPERDPLSFQSSDSEDEILAAYEAQQATRRMLAVQKSNPTSTGSSRTRKQDLPSSAGSQHPTSPKPQSPIRGCTRSMTRRSQTCLLDGIAGVQGVTSTTVDAMQDNVNNDNRQPSAQQLSRLGRGRRHTVDQRNQFGNQAAIGTTFGNSSATRHRSRSNLRRSPFVAQHANRIGPNVVEQLRSDGAGTQYPSTLKQSSPVTRRTRSMTRGSRALLTGNAGGQCVSTYTSTMTAGDSRSIAKQSSPVRGRTRSMTRASQASLLAASAGTQGVSIHSPTTTVGDSRGTVNLENRQPSAQSLPRQGRGRRQTVDQRNQFGNQAARNSSATRHRSRSNLRRSSFVAQQTIRIETNVVEQLRSDGADTQYPSSLKQSSPVTRRTRSMTRDSQALLTGNAGGQCVSTHTSTMTVGDSRSIANLENHHPSAQALAGNSCGHLQNQSRHPPAGRSTSENSNPTNRSQSNIRRKPLVAQQLTHNGPNDLQHLNSDDAVSLHRSSPKQSSSIVGRTGSMTRQTSLLTANVDGPGASSPSAQPPENQNSGFTLSGNTSATRYRSRSNLRRKPFVAQQVTRSNGADSQYPSSPKQSSPVRGRTRSMTRAGQGVSTCSSTMTAGDSRGVVNLENRQPSTQALPLQGRCRRDTVDQRIQLGKQTAKGTISKNSAATRRRSHSSSRGNPFVDQQVVRIAQNVVEHLRSNGADTQYPSSPKQSSSVRRRTRSMTRASRAMLTRNAGDLNKQASAQPSSRLGRGRRHTVDQRNQFAVGTISGNTSTTRYRSRSNVCKKRAVKHSTAN